MTKNYQLAYQAMIQKWDDTMIKILRKTIRLNERDFAEIYYCLSIPRVFTKTDLLKIAVITDERTIRDVIKLLALHGLSWSEVNRLLINDPKSGLMIDRHKEAVVYKSISYDMDDKNRSNLITLASVSDIDILPRADMYCNAYRVGLDQDYLDALSNFKTLREMRQYIDIVSDKKLPEELKFIAGDNELYREFYNAMVFISKYIPEDRYVRILNKQYVSSQEDFLNNLPEIMAILTNHNYLFGYKDQDYVIIIDPDNPKSFTTGLYTANLYERVKDHDQYFRLLNEFRGMDTKVDIV